MKRSGRVVLTLVVAISGVIAAPLRAQDPLSSAKALYEQAAYEDSLKVLDQLAASNPVPEVHQYRALCLIALGRSEAAERAIALVVATNPFFMPNPAEVAPRVVAMFAETRRKLLPQIIRRTFNDARTMFRDGDRQQAGERFDQVMKLLDDASLTEDQDLADLKLVASGFLDLARAQPASAPAPASAPKDTQASSPPLVTAVQPPPANVSAPANASAPANVPSSVVTPPVAVAQPLPQWHPPDRATARRAFSGAVKVQIDAEGKVTAAEMTRPVYPAYDRVVLAAARAWIYKPATRDGKPIGSETVVEIKLGPVN